VTEFAPFVSQCLGGQQLILDISTLSEPIADGGEQRRGLIADR